MLFIDTGLRLMEMTSIELEDIDWQNQAITVRKGKGKKARTVYFGKRTLKALDQYVNLKGGRRDHSHAHLKRLWLGKRGVLADAGIYAMLKGRGERAGLSDMYPHLWRHYFIHTSLKAGAQVGDIMRQTGHTKVEMLLHYGEAAADERARESHRRLGPGDNS
jgi:integrase